MEIDFDAFIAWAISFGLDTKSWSSNERVQFWTFFRYGWEARKLESEPSLDELNHGNGKAIS